MTHIEIWTGAAILYLVFILWYHNWRRPLRQEEIEKYFNALADQHDTSTNLDDLRAFCEADDGRDFIMMNIIRMQPENIPHPDTKERLEPLTVLQDYLKDFMPAFFKRAGHPVIQLRKAGPYIDSWNSGHDPDWSAVGLMRYRSRRDLMNIITDPKFSDAHTYKQAAIERSLTFPSTQIISFHPGPRISVAFILAFFASSDFLNRMHKWLKTKACLRYI